MFQTVWKLSAKDLFNEQGGLDKSMCETLVADYETDRANSVFTVCDFTGLVIQSKFYVCTDLIELYVEDHLDRIDIFSKQKGDWNEIINEENGKHEKWIIQKKVYIDALTSYEITIPDEIVKIIVDYADKEPKTVKIDPTKINAAFAVSYKSHYVGCVNCSVYARNLCWELVDVTYEDLEEHCATQRHKNALNMPIHHPLKEAFRSGYTSEDSNPF